MSGPRSELKLLVDSPHTKHYYWQENIMQKYNLFSCLDLQRKPFNPKSPKTNFSTESRFSDSAHGSETKSPFIGIKQLWIWILTISKRSHVWSTRKPGKRRVVMKQQRVDLLRENSLVLGPTGWFHKAWNFEAAMNISLVLTNYNNTIVFGFLLFFGFYIIM